MAGDSEEIEIPAASEVEDSPSIDTPAAEIPGPAPPVSWKWFGAALTLIVALFLLVPSVLAANDYRLAPYDAEDDFSQTIAQRLQYRYLEAFVALWFFSVGACIGSFLNVVVYRWPLGRSVVLRPSCCPQCGQRIRAIDNIPIVGWYRLRAACRNCRLPISARYPTIELLVGTIFLLFYFVELISGGINLPVRTPNLYKGMLYTVFYPKWDLILITAFHLLAICLVLVTWLMQYDGQKFPMGRWLLCLLALVTWSAIVPEVQPQPWSIPGLAASGLMEWQDSLLVSLTGAAVGAAVGWLLTSGLAASFSNSKPADWTAAGSLAMVGATFGWRGAIWIGGLATVSYLLSQWTGNPSTQLDQPTTRWHWTANVWVWMIVFLCSWRLVWYVTGWA